MSADTEQQLGIMRLVNLFMTPFAACLVLAALVFGSPGPRSAALAAALVAASATFNVFSMRLAARNPERFMDIRNLRVVVNHTVNIWLIWILVAHWRPIWLLFLLTMIAVGTYEGWETTLAHGVLLGGLLGLVCHFRGIVGMRAWAEIWSEAATLIFAGLFVNRLSAQIRSRL